MDWEEKEKERRKQVEEERKRLLALSDLEAESLPVPDRYQRLRYQREIFAHEWLMDLRRRMPVEQAREANRKPSFIQFNKD